MQKVVSKAQCWQMGRAPLGVQVEGAGVLSLALLPRTKNILFI